MISLQRRFVQGVVIRAKIHRGLPFLLNSLIIVVALMIMSSCFSHECH